MNSEAKVLASIAAINVNLESLKSVDQSSLLHLQLRTAVQDRPIKRAYLLGLGSLTDPKTLNSHKHIPQLVAFYQLVNYIDLRPGSEDKKQVRMYAIDPTFTTADLAILGHFEIQAYNHATECPDMDTQDSLLFSAYLSWAPLIFNYLAAGTKLPTILIDVSTFEENRHMLEKRYEYMLNTVAPANMQRRSKLDGAEICGHDWLVAAKVFDDLSCKYEAVDKDYEEDVVKEGLCGLVVYVRKDLQG